MATQIYTLAKWTDGNGSFNANTVYTLEDSIANVYVQQGRAQFYNQPTPHYPFFDGYGTDVVLMNQLSALPATGEFNQLYQLTTNGATYIWSGSSFINLGVGGGGGGANLSTTYTANNITIVSDSGTDALVNAVDGTNAGVVTTTQKAFWDSKEPAITAGTVGQYYRGDKTFQTLDKSTVGLGNVDNTSDATKNSATVTLTNKTISGASNTITNIAQSSVTNLTTDLAARATLSANNIFTGRNTFAATIGTWQTDTFAATEVLSASIQFGVINITSAFTMDSVTGAGAAGEAQVLYREFRQGATPFSISSWNTTNFEKVGASFPALTNTANARDFMTFTRSQNGKWLVTAGLNVS